MCGLGIYLGLFLKQYTSMADEINPGSVEINRGYVKGKKGILKIVEILFTCVAFACMVVANNGFDLIYKLYQLSTESDKFRDYIARNDFFLAIHIIGFIVAIVIFVVHLLSLQKSLGSARIWNILNLVFCVLLLVLCAVSGGVMIKFAKNEYKISFQKDDSDEKWPWIRWYTSNRIAAIAFSFLSAIVFLVDAIFQLPEVRGSE